MNAAAELTTSSEPTPSTSDSVADPSLLIQLHITEYQTLTTRNTYWITLQYALWPILLICLGFAAQLRNIVDPVLLAWGGALVVQIVVLAYYGALHEQYNNIRYVERELRPLIRGIIGSSPFWGYERYVEHHRGTSPAWWEYSLIGLSLVALALAATSRMAWGPIDSVGCGLNAVAAMLIGRRACNAVSVRRSFFQAA